MAKNEKKNKITTKKPVKPQTESLPGSSSSGKTVEGISENEQKKLQDIVMLSQLEYAASLKNKIIKEKKKEINALDAQIKEFMGPYMLIGYDLNDQPVEILSADSVAAHDALLERFRRVMYKITQNIINTNGGDPYGLSDSEKD